MTIEQWLTERNAPEGLCRWARGENPYELARGQARVRHTLPDIWRELERVDYLWWMHRTMCPDVRVGAVAGVVWRLTDTAIADKELRYLLTAVTYGGMLGSGPWTATMLQSAHGRTATATRWPELAGWYALAAVHATGRVERASLAELALYHLCEGSKTRAAITLAHLRSELQPTIWPDLDYAPFTEEHQ